MNKKRIKLTESDLHRIIKESVNKVVIGEAVLPVYNTTYRPKDDSDYYDGEYDELLFKGEDMFPDDVLHQAEMLRKMTGDKLKITITKEGNFTMFYNGSLSIESLQLILKVSKYLRTNRVYIDGSSVVWKTNNSYDKSHKTQVGNKFFDNVPKEHQVTKPKVLHTPRKPFNFYDGGNANEGNAFSSNGIGYF